MMIVDTPPDGDDPPKWYHWGVSIIVVSLLLAFLLWILP